MQIQQQSTIRLICYTVINIILVYYIAVLCHEYGHSVTAWLFGYKSHPFDIIYGSWYLIPASENVDFNAIYASGHPYQSGLIGIAGIFTNIVLFLICLCFLNQKYILKKPYFINFFFFLAAINLIEILAYIPNRTFTGTNGDVSHTGGDIGEFLHGFNLSPFWIFIPGIILVTLALYRFYQFELKKVYSLIPNKNLFFKRITLWLTFWPLIMFVVYWIPPAEYISLSYASNFYSIILVVYILIACDPSRLNSQKRGL